MRLGDIDLQSASEDASPETFGIIERFIHPNYNSPAQYNDIALLRLDRNVIFNEYISPICLQTTPNLQNTKLIATGWGRTEHGYNQSDVLLKVDLELFPNSVCQKNYATAPHLALPNGIQENSQICAGSHYEEKDTCQVGYSI